MSNFDGSPKYIAEFIGTFFLVLSILVVINTDIQSEFAPLAIGATLIAMIYTFGPISKAHFNPVVTLAFNLSKNQNRRESLFYIASQFSAGFVALLLVQEIFGLKSNFDPSAFKAVPAIISEFLGTFALVLVILNVALGKAAKDNMFYGTAIGLVVIGGIYMFSPFGSKACFNPIVAVVTFLNGHNTFTNLIYIVTANTFGSLVAVLTFFKLRN